MKRSKRLGPLHCRGKIYYCMLYERGGRRERSLRTTDKKEAMDRYLALRNQQEENALPNDRRKFNLGAALNDYLENRKLRLTASSFASEQSITRALMAHYPSGSTLQQIATWSSIQSYQNARLHKKISEKTINNEVQVLRRVFEEANLWTGELKRRYRSLKVHASDIPGELSEEESARLHEAESIATSASYIAFAALVALHTGMRSGEIRNLTLGDVRLSQDDPIIVVRRSTTKTDKGARHVPLDPIAVWACTKLLHRSQVLGATTPTHFLFPGLRMRQTASGVNVQDWDATVPCACWERAWRSFRKAIGIQRRFHDLRHSFISNAARAQVPIAVVQEIVGHMNPRMVQWYTHVSRKDLRRAAQQIEQYQQQLVSSGPWSRSNGDNILPFAKPIAVAS